MTRIPAAPKSIGDLEAKGRYRPMCQRHLPFFLPLGRTCTHSERLEASAEPGMPNDIRNGALYAAAHANHFSY